MQDSWYFGSSSGKEAIHARLRACIRVLKKTGNIAVKPLNPKYIPKPYEQMSYPGQRVQIDVKFVPAACIVGEASGQKFYQYTAIDEYSRFRYLEAFEEHSIYSSAIFLEHLIKAFPFPMRPLNWMSPAEYIKAFLKNGELF